MENLVDNNEGNGQGAASVLEMLSASTTLTEKQTPASNPGSPSITDLLGGGSGEQNAEEKKETTTETTNTTTNTEQNSQQQNTQQSNTNTDTQSEHQQETVEEISQETFSALLSDATEGQIQSLDQVYQLMEENKRLTKLAENPAGLFTDPTQKSIYEFLNAYKASDFDSGIQAYARVKSLDIQNMKPEDALREKYVLDNMKYGLTRAESEKMFQSEFDKKYGELGDLTDQFLKKDGYEAKKALAEMQEQYTKPKVDDQRAVMEQQAKVQQEQYSSAIQKTLEGYKSLIIGIDDKAENDFTFELEDLPSVVDAMNDPQGYLNSRWVDQKGDINAAQIKQDITILQNLDKILDGVVKHATTIAREEAIRERNNITNKNNPAASNAGQGSGGGTPKNWTESLMNATIKKV